MWSQPEGWSKVCHTPFFLCVLTACLHSSQMWLDTCTKWATHVWWHQPSHQHTTIILFPRWPSPLPRVVQRNGTDNPQVGPLAYKQAVLQMPQVQMLTAWGAVAAQLLLLTHPLHTARFHITKAAASRVYWIMWPPMWFLFKVPLWIEFYWAVLGCSQASLPCCWPCKNPWCDGKEDAWVSWWCPPWTNQKVCFLFSFLFFSFQD